MAVEILLTEHLNYFPYKINFITKYFVFTLLAAIDVAVAVAVAVEVTIYPLSLIDARVISRR